MVDRSSATPLWAQIDADLRSRLLQGEFNDGFPTEPDLMSTYQVSRSTVRQAVASLERAGLVERRRGSGTRVADRPLVDAMAGMYSMAGWIARTGLSERSVVPICELQPLPDEAAERLGLEQRTIGAHIMRVRYAGDEPIAIDRSWLPERVGTTLLDQDLTAGSLYQRLTEIGIRPTASTEQIRPANPGPDDRILLDLPPKEMAFRIDRTVYAKIQPIEHRVSLVRGDKYALTAAWGDPPAESEGTSEPAPTGDDSVGQNATDLSQG
jgi:GntR family transcriptional regulator